jgi:hypothetical protein
MAVKKTTPAKPAATPKPTVSAAKVAQTEAAQTPVQNVSTLTPAQVATQAAAASQQILANNSAATSNPLTAGLTGQVPEGSGMSGGASSGGAVGGGASAGTNANLSTATAANAFDVFRQKFQAAGLGSLADSLLSLSTSPQAPTTASGYYAALLQTPEYQKRFGDTNAMRVKNGLPMLSEGQILTAEQNITDTLRNAGMPAGFYDQPQDLQQFIALDKSAAEVGDIVQAYQNVAQNVNPDVANALQTYYGIGTSGIAAALMDPTKAQPILNALAQKGTVGAAAAQAGMTDIQGASQVANALGAGSLSYAKQAQAFQQANLLNQQAGTLSNIYGPAYGNYNTAQGLQEALSGPNAVEAAATRQRLTTAEESAFGGSAGASTQGQSLGIATAQGVS